MPIKKKIFSSYMYIYICVNISICRYFTKCTENDIEQKHYKESVYTL